MSVLWGQISSLALRGIAVFLAAFCLSFAYASVPAASENASASPASLLERPVRIGYFHLPPFSHGRNDAERKEGYAYEYLQKLATFTSWRYEYVYGTWTELFLKLSAGEIDIMPKVNRYADRDRFISFPQSPMGKEIFHLYVRYGQSWYEPQDPQCLNGKIIAVLALSEVADALRAWLEENSISAYVVEMGTVTDDAYLAACNVDALASTNMGVPTGWVAQQRLGERDYYLAVSKKRPDILRELENAVARLDNVQPYFLDLLQSHTVRTSPKTGILADERRYWSGVSGPVRVGYRADMAPYSLDGKPGELPVGAVGPVLKRVTTLLGWQGQIVPEGFPDHVSLVKALKEGRIDVALPVQHDSWVAECSKNMLTAPFVSTQVSALYLTDTCRFDRIIMGPGMPMNPQQVKERFPKATIVQLDPGTDLDDALRAGKADCILTNAHTALSFAEKRAGIHVLPFGVDVGLCCVTRASNRPLLSLFNAAVASVDSADVAKEVTDIALMRGKLTGWDVLGRYGYAIGIFLALVLCIIIFLAVRDARRQRFFRLQAERAREEAERARMAAERANRAKGQFISNMSHEFCTPINAILGISEILLAKNLPSSHADYVATIRSSGRRLHSIVSDILDYSRIEAGSLEIQELSYSLHGLLSDVGREASLRLTDKPVRFSLYAEPALPQTLVGDESRVRQVVSSLLDNACRFTQQGEVALAVTGRASPDGTCHMCFTVSDTGIGIKPEDKERLFRVFSQLDAGMTRSVEGTGLGLAIANRLAGLMGGGIECESVPGSGSVFTVRLVQKVADASPLFAIRYPEQICVLVLDREGSLARQACAILERLGVASHVCADLDSEDEAKAASHLLANVADFGHCRARAEERFAPGHILLVHDLGKSEREGLGAFVQLESALMGLQLPCALEGGNLHAQRHRPSFDRRQILPLSFARVLVVDDNKTNLQVARGLLAPYRMQVETAASGVEAIGKVRETRYDLVFMDHMMPGLDGIETFRRIKAMGGATTKDLAIVALTANATAEARAEFAASGFDDFLAKPIDMGELNRVLVRLVQSKASAAYLEQAREEAAHEEAWAAEQASADAERGAGAGASSPQASALQALLATHVPAVDMEAGLDMLGGNVAAYTGIFRVFASDIAERCPELERLVQAHDLTTFTISVHAIKSAARSVGAMALGEAAYELELAGKAGDWKAISRSYPAFHADLAAMSEGCARVVAALSEGSPHEEPRREFREAPDAALLAELQGCLAEMDYDGASTVLGRLDAYAYPPAVQEVLSAMNAAIANFDYEKLDELCESLAHKGKN